MDKPLIVYSKNRCVQCDWTKKYLQEKNIEYLEYNVEEDYEALLYVTSLGFKAAPVVFWGTESWTGYQPDKLAQIK
jgi:glutaredoxin-like protein NrdH